MKKAWPLLLILTVLLSLAGCASGDAAVTETLHIHTYAAAVTPPTCHSQGYTDYACPCGDSYRADFLEATDDHRYEDGFCVTCRREDPNVDLFVFAGQSNMMGAAALAPGLDTFTDLSREYKYNPRLRTGGPGEFVPAGLPAGEFYYKDLTAAYGEKIGDLTYLSPLKDYSVNTWFCPGLRDGSRAYTMQSEASLDPAPSLAPYFVTEYAAYGHKSVYAHMTMGSAKITYYFTREMIDRYNSLAGEDCPAIPDSAHSGAGEAFDEKYLAMLQDFAAFAPEKTVKNRCFIWLQGESDSRCTAAEYQLKLEVLWEHLQSLGFTHFFILRVGYWDNPGILNVIRAQETFCAENENCHIITRAPSLIPNPGVTTENWWLTQPDPAYGNCRDCYINGRGNLHFNEKAMEIFAVRGAENVHRILHLGQDPILEEENIRALAE